LEDVSGKDERFIAISDGVFVEWKTPGIVMASVAEEREAGVDVVRISTASKSDWVRLRIDLPGTARTVQGFRILLKIEANASQMPVKLGAIYSTNQKRFQELQSVEKTRFQPYEGAWHEISAALVVPASSKGRRVSIAIDLPKGAEMLMGGLVIEEHGISVPPSAGTRIEAIGKDAFRMSEVSDLAGASVAPPVFAHDLKIEGNRIVGWALTRLDTLVATVDRSDRALVLPLKGGATVAGFELDAVAIDAELEDGFLDAPTLELRVDRAAQDPVIRLAQTIWRTLAPATKAASPRDRQDNVVLLWAPISTAGLTVQLEQVARILEKNKFQFRISYHVAPRIDHPLREHWVDPRDIDRPKLVIYFERFVEFDRGFDAAFKVFYLNLDWLSDLTLRLARTHAKVVFCPTPYRLGDLAREFENSQIVHLPWPAQIDMAPAIDESSAKAAAKAAAPLRVLYVGNDYDEVSRKHPFEVVEAVEKLDRDDLVVDLKFRSPLPKEVRQRLLSSPCIGRIVDWPTDQETIAELYAAADVNLIPNACEGNGLSILESWATMTIPAVLDGHPMKDVTSPENSFRIPCSQVSFQKWAPYYQTTAETILDFLSGLTREAVATRMETVRAMAGEMKDREAQLEKQLISCVMMSGMRTRGLRERVQQAHRPSRLYPDLAPRGGDRVRDLMFKDEGQRRLMRPPRLIDVMLTSSQRPWAPVLCPLKTGPFGSGVFG
jgi:glycosyltransferase involved in cell wall biosynthesis